MAAVPCLFVKKDVREGEDLGTSEMYLVTLDALQVAVHACQPTCSRDLWKGDTEWKLEFSWPALKVWVQNVAPPILHQLLSLTYFMKTPAARCMCRHVSFELEKSSLPVLKFKEVWLPKT